VPTLPDVSADGRLRLSLAVGAYDHVRDLTAGLVRPTGIELLPLDLPVEEIFFRLASSVEWDVSEFSLGKYVSLRSRGEDALIAIPVFPSRVFRLSSFYVRQDAGLVDVADLAGRRVGVPEWSVTATVYARGYMTHDAGVALTDVDWVQAGMNEPGRLEKAVLDLPEGVRYRSVPDRSLQELLLAGDIDAIVAPRPPAAFVAGDARVVRLVPDFRAREEAHFRATGIFPIMHTIVIRREILDRHPWAAGTLVNAFEEAKRRSVARARDATASWYPIPWSHHAAQHAVDLMGEDFWPYGVEPNRTTLDAFLGFAHEQGLCHRRLAPEELFPEQVLRRHVV
jgi:4,5-dihydroxyphthalate decarboxylase